MLRLFVDPKAWDGTCLQLSKDQYHHGVRASRLEIGESIEVVVDRRIQVLAEVILIKPDSLILKVIRQAEVGALKSFHLTLVQCLPKADKFSEILRSGTELGVDVFLPVVSQRTVPVLDQESGEKKRQRWMKIVESASEQSAQIRIPEVLAVEKLNHVDWSSRFSNALKIVAWEGESNLSLKQALKNQSPSEVVVLVGPEGGLSIEEVEELKKVGFLSVSLGKTILRVEHAGFLACGQVLYQLD